MGLLCKHNLNIFQPNQFSGRNFASATGAYYILLERRKYRRKEEREGRKDTKKGEHIEAEWHPGINTQWADKNTSLGLI